MKERKNKGITLISLVITIIVLLILAGITISGIVGNDGVLNQADKAKTETEQNDIIDNARFDIIDKQASNLGTISASEVKEILTSKYGELNGEVTDEDTVLITKQGYRIPVWKIWNSNRLNYKIMPNDYGKSINYTVEVNGITIDKWRVFYNDGTNVYIITENYVPNKTMEDLRIKSSGEYCGVLDSIGFDSDILEQRVEYQSRWSDSSLMKKYVAEGIAKEAFLGPSIEIFINSWNSKGYKTLYCNNSNEFGINIGVSDKPLTHFVDILSNEEGYNDNLYFPTEYNEDYEGCYGYWLITSNSNDRDRFSSVDCKRRIGCANYGGFSHGFRPVVCLDGNVVGNITEHEVNINK